MLFEEIDLFMWYYSFLQNYNCTHLSFWSYQVNTCKDIIIPAYVLDGSADSHIYLTYELLDCSSGKMFMLILKVLTCSINKLHMSEQRLYLSLLLDIPYWHFLHVDSKYARIARVAVMLRLSDSDTSSSRNRRTASYQRSWGWIVCIWLLFDFEYGYLHVRWRRRRWGIIILLWTGPNHVPSLVFHWTSLVLTFCSRFSLTC